MNEFENILITTRDIEILTLLNKVKLMSSKIIKEIISPWISNSTLTHRLLKLEKKGYIEEINKERIKTQYKIFSISKSLKKIDEVKSIIWVDIMRSNYTLTHLLYNHELLIWETLCYIVRRIRDKKKEYIFETKNFISQYEITKWFNWVMKNRVKDYL